MMRVKWSIHVLVKCITASLSPFSVAAAHLELNELAWFVGENDDFAVAETTSDFPVQCKTRAKSDGLTC